MKKNVRDKPSAVDSDGKTFESKYLYWKERGEGLYKQVQELGNSLHVRELTREEHVKELRDEHVAYNKRRDAEVVAQLKARQDRHDAEIEGRDKLLSVAKRTERLLRKRLLDQKKLSSEQLAASSAKLVEMTKRLMSVIMNGDGKRDELEGSLHNQVQYWSQSCRYWEKRCELSDSRVRSLESDMHRLMVTTAALKSEKKSDAVLETGGAR